MRLLPSPARGLAQWEIYVSETDFQIYHDNSHNDCSDILQTESVTIPSFMVLTTPSNAMRVVLFLQGDTKDLMTISVVPTLGCLALSQACVHIEEDALSQRRVCRSITLQK
jgi:hypothetical protein